MLMAEGEAFIWRGLVEDEAGRVFGVGEHEITLTLTLNSTKRGQIARSSAGKLQYP